MPVVALDSFYRYCYELGLSSRSCAEYSKWARRWCRWCSRHDVDPLRPSRGEVRDWAETLPGSWASRKQARTALRHWCTCHDAGDVWEAVISPRKPRPRYRGLTHTQAVRVHQAAQLAGGRAGMATIIILYTGARASEVAGMRWDGVGYRQQTIAWWRPKTSEIHMVPLHRTLADALARFGGNRPEGFIFPGDRGAPHVQPGTVWEWVHRIGEMAGVDVSPHQLRATAISTVLEGTSDLDAAAEFAGHRDPTVTRSHYTQTSRRRLEAAVDALTY